MKSVLKKRGQNNQRRDLIVAVCTVALVYVLSATFDLAERFIAWSAPLDHYEIDELPLVFLAIALVSAWFSVRRMYELAAEIDVRIKAEKKSHESLTRFQTLFEEGLSGNFIADMEGNILICNEAFRTMSGMALSGQQEFSVTKALGQKWQNIIHICPESGYLDFAELELQRPDKGAWVVMARFRPALSEQGKLQEIHGYFTDITEQYLAEKELAQLFLENRALAGHAMQAQEEERCRLAREIHDDVGQYLTAIRLDAATIPKIDNSTTATVHLTRIAKHAEHIQTAIKRIIKRLRPAALDAHGLVEAIQLLAQDWRSRNPDIDCKLTLDKSCGQLPEPISIIIYRIVQEALTNISRHSQAHHVSIDINQQDLAGHLLVRIKDDGIGFQTTDSFNSFGLTGMRERIESVQGKFRLMSNPGAGVVITAIIPFILTRKNTHVENIIG